MAHARVLVVDDVATNLDVARGMLNPYGLQVDCVISGQQAINAIRDEKVKYDAVFMDHMMPEMDGIEAVRIIRGEIGTDYAKTIPVIALTANAIVGSDAMFLKNGFQDFISKPIDVLQLDTVLNKWIRGGEYASGLKTRNEELKNGQLCLFRNFEIEGIDFAKGIKIYSSEEAYIKLLRSYHLHTPPVLEKMGTLGLENGISLSEYTIIIHGIKGSSYGICANHAGQEAEKLEIAARAGDYKKVMKKNSSFISMMESLLSSLNGFLSETAEREIKQEKNSPDPILLLQLLEAAKEYKASAMEQTIRQLETYEYEAGGDLIVWLRKQMDNLEYDAIRGRLEAAS